MTQLDIRLADSTDISALRAMQERSMRVLGRHHYTATQIEAFIARIGTMDEYLVHDRTYLLAAIEGELVGSGGWTTRLPGYARHIEGEPQPCDPARAIIRSVFVEPLVARHGVGRSMMAAVENAMRAEGFSTAELGATDSGLAFYRRLGYRPLARSQVTVGDGITLGLTRMRKPLAAANEDTQAPASLSA
jgi:GNAT superfamily N-acetyltransferase